MVNPEPWIERLSEFGRKRVLMDFCVLRAHLVEWKSSSRPVQIHSYSVLSCIGFGDCHFCGLIIVPGMAVPPKLTAETPGLIVRSKLAVMLSLSAYAFVCHCNSCPFTTPLHFPVAASRQALSAQHLLKDLKPFWVIRMWILSNIRCLSVSFGESKLVVGRVWVHIEFTSICGGQSRDERDWETQSSTLNTGIILPV